MPNIKSAIKRVTQNEAKNNRNRAERTEIASMIKKVHVAVEANDLQTAKALLPLVYKTLDQASANGIIHKNNADNKKSALTKLVNDLESGKLVITAKIDNKTRIAEKRAKEAAEKEAAREAAKKLAAEKASKKAAKPAKATKAAKAEEVAPATEVKEEKPVKKTTAKKAADGAEKPATKKTTAKKAAEPKAE